MRQNYPSEHDRRSQYFPRRAEDTGRALGPASDTRIEAMAYCVANHMPLIRENIVKAANILQKAKADEADKLER